MTRAFLFDSLCGMVYRCMFAGLDDYGHALWVNITPGEEPKTLDEYVEDEDLEGMRFFVLSMEGETAQPQQVAKRKAHAGDWREVGQQAAGTGCQGV